MPIYEIDNKTKSLVPFHRLRPGPDLYESEIEDLVWSDLEAFAGEALFPVARQPKIAGGGRPDVLALDESGRVVVIEIKRDIDRGQLAQCLEYAGWARLASLDEIAGLYRASATHSGPESFFRDWQEFTDSSTPVTINPSPRLILIARDFEGRTRSALDFLQESSLPVTVVPVSIYADSSERRVLNIEADHEPARPPIPGGPRVTGKAYLANGQRVTVTDLLDAGVLQAGEVVEFTRPKLGQHYTSTINADGSFTNADGTVHQSPSLAAMRSADLVSYDGWLAWRVPRLGGARLHDLRLAHIAEAEAPAGD